MFCWTQNLLCLLQWNNPSLTANNGQKTLDITRHSCCRCWPSPLQVSPFSVKITSKTCCQWSVVLAARPHKSPWSLCIYRKPCRYQGIPGFQIPSLTEHMFVFFIVSKFLFPQTTTQWVWALSTKLKVTFACNMREQRFVSARRQLKLRCWTVKSIQPFEADDWHSRTVINAQSNQVRWYAFHSVNTLPRKSALWLVRKREISWDSTLVSPRGGNTCPQLRPAEVIYLSEWRNARLKTPTRRERVFYARQKQSWDMNQSEAWIPLLWVNTRKNK